MDNMCSTDNIDTFGLWIRLLFTVIAYRVSAAALEFLLSFDANSTLFHVTFREHLQTTTAIFHHQLIMNTMRATLKMPSIVRSNICYRMPYGGRQITTRDGWAVIAEENRFWAYLLFTRCFIVRLQYPVLRVRNKRLVFDKVKRLNFLRVVYTIRFNYLTVGNFG